MSATTAELALAELEAFSSREELIDELVLRASESLELDTPPTWAWATGRRGRASNSTHSITLPRWAGDESSYWPGHRTQLYLAAYVVHECAHLPADSYGHGPAFKAHERRALRDVLGVGIRYMRHYAAELFDDERRERSLYVSQQETKRRTLRDYARRVREQQRLADAAGEAER